MKRAGAKAVGMLAVNEANNLPKPPTSAADLVKIIRTGDELDNACLAFLAFRDHTNQQVRVFDMDAVEKWCKNNGAQCQ